TDLSEIWASTRRREARSPFFAFVIIRSATGRRRLALVTVVLICLCSNSWAAMLLSMRRSCVGDPPRRGPLVGVCIVSYSYVLISTVRLRRRTGPHQRDRNRIRQDCP